MIHCKAFRIKEKNIVCLHFLVLHENIRYDYVQKNNLTIEKYTQPNAAHATPNNFFNSNCLAICLFHAGY